MNHTPQNRNSLLDIARIIAIVAVVIIHCSAPFVKNFGQNTAEFLTGNLFDAIARIGVPWFLMISGALFLDERKEVTLKDILQKRVKGLVILTIVWAAAYSVIYNVVVPMLNGSDISIKDAVFGVIKGHYHMWYLYMIIGLYIITPFLKKFVCKENKKMVLFFILVSFVVQFVTPLAGEICRRFIGVDYIGTLVEKFHLDFFGGYITYFLAGWYIVQIGIPQKFVRGGIYVASVLSLAFIFVYVYVTGDYTNGYADISAPVFVYSVGTFLALYNLKINIKEKTTGILAVLSKLTFGVYIIHVVLLSVFRKVLPYSQNVVIYIVVATVVVTCVSFLGTYVISKIPLIKKLIRA